MALNRSTAALLGIFAILLQALLFGFHHHDLAYAAPGAPLALSVAPSHSPLSPAVDADDCEICIALHHQAVAPVVFVTPPLSAAAAAAAPAPAAGGFAPAFSSAFNSRAPPRV